MTTRDHLVADQFNEETLPEVDEPSSSRAARDRSRDVHFLDFKDGTTDVAIAHGPVDPSRICITLRSGDSIMQVSVEEGIGREIAQGLADVLRTFREVRSRLR